MESRGIFFSISEIRESIKRENAIRHQPKQANKTLLVTGYLFMPLTLVAGTIGGFFTIFVGLYLLLWRGVDENGNYYPLFNKKSQNHGFVMVWGSCFLTVLYFVGLNPRI